MFFTKSKGLNTHSYCEAVLFPFCWAVATLEPCKTVYVGGEINKMNYGYILRIISLFHTRHIHPWAERSTNVTWAVRRNQSFWQRWYFLLDQIDISKKKYLFASFHVPAPFFRHTLSELSDQTQPGSQGTTLTINMSKEETRFPWSLPQLPPQKKPLPKINSTMFPSKCGQYLHPKKM